MMNLVQLQERLRDVPMQALMQYANGGNPQIPPFLALGELNRRKKMQETAAAEQAQEMEGAPTVKQQIEQAAGLMALQGNRQQQAARQQQTAQANAPMAAPNTTTSEPAQLASGGYIEDIVVPRDFQAGGPTDGLQALRRMMLMQKMQKRRPQQQMNMKRPDYAEGGQVAGQAGMDPEMLRRLMAMMKQRQAGAQPRAGLSRLAATEMQPMNPGMAGGGIVAFQQGGMPDTSDTMRKKAEQYRSLIEMLFGKSKDKVDPTDRTKIFKETVTEERPGENYSNEGRNYPADTGREFKRTEIAPAPERETSGIAALSEPRAPRSRETEWEKYASGILNRPDRNIQEELRARGLLERPKSTREMEESRRQLQELQDQDTFTNRLLALEAGRFGSGRLGKSVAAYEQGRMSKANELRKIIAKAEDLETQADYAHKMGQFKLEEDLRKEADKTKMDAANLGSAAQSRRESAEVGRMQATRPTDFERQKELYLQHARETGEKPTAQGFQRFMLGSKASTVMTMEDAIRIAATSLGPGATMEEISQRAREIMRMAGNQAPGGATATPANRPPIGSFQK